jgi:hypothetical protein
MGGDDDDDGDDDMMVIPSPSDNVAGHAAHHMAVIA